MGSSPIQAPAPFLHVVFTFPSAIPLAVRRATGASPPVTSLGRGGAAAWTQEAVPPAPTGSALTGRDAGERPPGLRSVYAHGAALKLRSE